jgi:hypothetical protein
MALHITVAYVTIADQKNQRKKPEDITGKKRGIRKKPHVIYAALNVCIIHR